MLKASFKKYQLQFKLPVRTSRGEMTVKNGYYLFITDGVNTGVGECSYIEGLSVDDLDNYETTLQSLCATIRNGKEQNSIFSKNFPSITFGLETALLDLKNGGKKILFESDFTKGKAAIPINGLVWMGDKDFMLRQIEQKIADGFKCIKLKIGGIDFNDELALLSFIRNKFPAGTIEIRLDANGAFKHNDVFKKLEKLSKYHIHSIEQPVKSGQYDLMRRICDKPLIPVALDEELIQMKGITKPELLSTIKPQYLVLKPSLLGGWQVCDEWLNLAAQHQTGWWATSALESNIGLNAIAQWAFIKQNNVVHGLSTGGLYSNNVTSPLFMENGGLGYKKDREWGVL